MAQLMSIKKNVDVQPGAGVPAIFHCSQGDKGTRIILGLLNNNDSYTIPEGTTAIIRGSRADGTLFTEITADIDTTTEIKFNLTEDMTSVAGPVECEAVMSSGTANVIGTANFIVNVEKSPASVGSVFPGTDAAETWLVNELTNLDISDLDDESVVDAINSKLGGTFETTDAGKVLMVNNDGTVSPEDVDLSGKASESTIAPEFSTSASYTAGQYVYKNGVLYRFTSDHAAGAWTGTDAEVVTVGGELTGLKADLNNQYIKEFYEVVKSPNMIDGEDSLTTGYMAKTGSVDHTTTSMCYTDYIPVSEGDVVRAYEIASRIFSNRHLRMMCCFDANKAVMSSVGSNNDMALFTVPAGVSYIRATLYDSAAITDHMLTLNYEATEFEPYGEQQIITEDFLTSESKNAVDALVNNAYTRKLVANRYACGAPKRDLKMTIELQQPWYIESLVSQPFLSIDLRAAGDHKRYEDRIEFQCTEPKDGANGYAFRVYDEVFGAMLYNVLTYAPAGYGLPCKWANLNLSDCSLLAIGDSTVDQDVMTSKILDEFTAQGHTITLLGTLGSGLNKNEGRAGWKATDYLTNRQYEGTVNPFYNPASATFDFNYYMTNQGYTAPDFVVIQLGINDLYNLAYDAVPTAIETTWNAIKTMIDSILAYNANIKIILNLPTTPKNNITAHTAFLPLYRNTRMMYNDYAQEQARAYSTNKVRVSYCHLILNADTDIYDTVHPNTGGYTKMAKEIVSQINVWQN